GGWWELSPIWGGASARVTARPAGVAVAGRTLSLAELAEAAAAVAARIEGLPGVAVEATPTLETVVAVLGGLAAGVPVIPVPSDAGPLERTHILRDCAAPALLAAAGTIPENPVGIDVVPFRIAERAPSALRPARARRRPEDPALILYTSGTTGPPKGVVLSAGAIATGLDLLAGAWAWTPEDVLVHGLPLFHVHGLILGVLGALRVG